jgi:hypothetical protein
LKITAQHLAETVAPRRHHRSHQPFQTRRALGKRDSKGDQLTGCLYSKGATTERIHQLADVLPAIGRPLPVSGTERKRCALA